MVSTGCEHIPPDSLPLALVGRLEKIDAASIVMAGGMPCLFVRDSGSLDADSARISRCGVISSMGRFVQQTLLNDPGIELTRRRAKAGILMEQARESVVLYRQVVDALKEHASPHAPPRPWRSLGRIAARWQGRYPRCAKREDAGSA